MNQASDAAHIHHDDACAILERITDAFFSLNRNRRFIFPDRQAEKIPGRARKGLAGKNIRIEHPDLIVSEIDFLSLKVANDKMPCSMTTSYLAQHCWHDVRTSSAQFGISVCFRDVTGRTHADHAQRHSEERHRSCSNRSTKVSPLSK